MAEKLETIKVDGQEMQTYLALPESAGPHPGLVVIHHRRGVDDFVLEMINNCASEGYVGIAPDLFYREGPESARDVEAQAGLLRDANIIQDVNATIEHLLRHEQVQGEPVGILGFCLGGRITYLMAASNPDLKAAAVFYGGNTMVSRGEGPSPFDLTANISCPVLGLFGLEDQNPSPDDVRKIDAEMTRLGVIHEFHSYEGTGHAFMNSRNSGYREHAASEAWAQAIAWFEKHLVGAKAAA